MLYNNMQRTDNGQWQRKQYMLLLEHKSVRYVFDGNIGTFGFCCKHCHHGGRNVYSYDLHLLNISFQTKNTNYE